MMRELYRLLSFLGNVKAASRGPGAYARRRVRQAGHRELAKAFRRSKWTRP